MSETRHESPYTFNEWAGNAMPGDEELKNSDQYPQNIDEEVENKSEELDAEDIELSEEKDCLEIKLSRRNRIFYDALKKHKYWKGSILAVERDIGVDQASIYLFLNLKVSPIYLRRKGKQKIKYEPRYKQKCKWLARELDMPVEKLFPLNLYRHLLKPEHFKRMGQEKDDKLYEEQTELVETRYNKRLVDAIVDYMKKKYPNRKKYKRYLPIKDFCDEKEVNLNYAHIRKLISFSYSPFAKNREAKTGTRIKYTEFAENVCAVLKALPQDLFPEKLYKAELKRKKDEDTVFTGDYLEEFFSGTKEQDIFKEVSDKQLSEKLLSALNLRQRSIIEMRHGVGENRVHSLEEVGQKLNLTRERVRQIEDKANRKMKRVILK
ncbi:MAG: sigma factor-like helix-turn-helix DNA-binding protein [bacterium]